MRILILTIALAMLTGCSCSRQPDTGNGNSAAAVSQAPVEDAARAHDPSAPIQAANPQAEALTQAADTVHAYLAALAARDRTRADAYWAGGKPPPRVEDSSLRNLDDLHSLRIDSAAPSALDNESPARSVEVPVTLRIRDGHATYTLNGAYRLRRAITGDGWEITSASLHPALD